MIRVPTQMTVADYCAAMNRGEIIVNKTYQRSDKIWPDTARSFLIETVLKGFPIPKFYLFQRTDVKTKKTIKEIVDGQQRSSAIKAYYEGSFPLTKAIPDNPAIQGKSYQELDEDDQHRFLDYSIDADLFTASNNREVVEVFRRMNSYMAPLNPEEQRHAEYQGLFKWFINSTAKNLNAIFLNAGIFTEKQLVRMQDNKLLTELCDAFSHGIRTTSKTTLNTIYRHNDQKFQSKQEYASRLSDAFETISELDDLANTSLMKPFMIYSLVLALTHVKKPLSTLTPTFKVSKKRVQDAVLTRNLEKLVAANDEDDEDGMFGSFVTASSEKTNTADTRKIRFKWFCRALTETFS